MIEITDLQKTYGSKRAVDIEHYTIADGDMLGLVGNNGAGKTTLFRLILDLVKADQGTVAIAGTDVTRTEDWKDITGAYIDDGFLIDYLTPEEYFYFIGRMYGLKKDDVDERLRPFDRFMNGEVLGQKKFIRNYSMGNKQKIGIISAMLHHPRLLILDEPFNFLDPSSQAIIKHLLRAYHEEHGATILISSHNLNHTVDICPRIALLEHGVILRDIDNRDGQAEKELEDYFNLSITRSKNRRKRTLRAHSSFLILHSSFICFLLCLTGCRTAAPPLDYRALVRAADRLGVDIGPKDHHALYLEAAQWIGTPYRSGGQSRKGTDCSGFVRQVYKKVYDIDLPRSTTEQVEEGKRVRRRKLREGDLVFFHGSKRRRANHVGIYLKEGKFVHASTSRGVMVSRLDEDYWDEHWLRGRRIN